VRERDVDRQAKGRRRVTLKVRLKMRSIVAIVSLVVLGCSQQESMLAGLPEADVVAIRSAYRDMTAAGTAGDFRNLGRFFTEDAVWMPADQPAVEGRADVQARFTVGAVQWDIDVLEIEGRGDLAFARSAYTLILDIPDFAPVTGKLLDVWRKQPDGSWLIARSSFSSDAPAS